MKKITLGIVAMLAILASAITGCVNPAQGDGAQKITIPVPQLSDISMSPGIIWSQQNVGIWVSGEGKVKANPDIAILGLGVEVQQKTVAEAQRQAAEAMSKVMKVLSGRGVADKDIQTTQYNIYPVKRWDDKGQVEILLGYRVSNMVQVKIRKIEDAGGIIDAVASAGGDAIRINSIGFSIDDPTNYYKQARKSRKGCHGQGKANCQHFRYQAGKGALYYGNRRLYSTTDCEELFKGRSRVST